MRISWSGRLRRVSSWAFCAEVGERARFLVGRRERGSAETGIDSGPVPDILGFFDVLSKALTVPPNVTLRHMTSTFGWLVVGRVLSCSTLEGLPSRFSYWVRLGVGV